MIATMMVIFCNKVTHTVVCAPVTFEWNVAHAFWVDSQNSHIWWPPSLSLFPQRENSGSEVVYNLAKVTALVSLTLTSVIDDCTSVTCQHVSTGSGATAVTTEGFPGKVEPDSVVSGLFWQRAVVWPLEPPSHRTALDTEVLPQRQVPKGRSLWKKYHHGDSLGCTCKEKSLISAEPPPLFSALDLHCPIWKPVAMHGYWAPGT